MSGAAASHAVARVRVPSRGGEAIRRLPPHAYFVGSAVFHYLGPACAVLLFARVSPLGVAWLRIASAALVFAAWRRPWRLFVGAPWSQVRDLIALGVVLGAMNSIFYLAIARLPLGTGQEDLDRLALIAPAAGRRRRPQPQAERG